MPTEDLDEAHENRGADVSATAPPRHIEPDDVQQHYEEDAHVTLAAYGCCHPVLADDRLLAAITEFVLRAEFEVLEEVDGSCVLNHHGVRSHQLRAMYGTTRLRELNWIREEVDGQVRFRNDVDYPVPVRLCLSSGWKGICDYNVYSKGTRTRAVTAENLPWLDIGSLFEEYPSREQVTKYNDLVQNFWVYVHTESMQTGEWWITISIGLPYHLSKSGRRMKTLKDRVIFNRRVSLGIDSLASSVLPQPEAVDFEISERDNTEVGSDGPD